jgi:hypothetical protein
VAARVAPHKRVRLLDFVDQIPKSASGNTFHSPISTAAVDRV